MTMCDDLRYICSNIHESELAEFEETIKKHQNGVIIEEDWHTFNVRDFLKPMEFNVDLKVEPEPLNFPYDESYRMMVRDRVGIYIPLAIEPADIKRPKNLKYPHKKRAKRIYNKWRKRYGVNQRYLSVPNAEIAFDEDRGEFTIKAK